MSFLYKLFPLIFLATILAQVIPGKTQQQWTGATDKLKPRHTKPPPNEWIKGRKVDEKVCLIAWLIDGERDCSQPIKPRHEESLVEYQSFDGFYNNAFKVDLGAVDTPLLRRVPSVYEDGVYLPVRGKRINPFSASENLMNRRPTCNNDVKEACGSKTGKTAFLVFFGQQLVEEILDAQRPACPPEYFNIEIKKDSEQVRVNKVKKKAMPFLRSRWSQETGHSPGNPRQQLNEITPYLDGNLVYGTSKGWADVLRTFPNGSLAEHGMLASEDGKGLYPVRNTIRLPLANPPPPAFHMQWTRHHETARVDRFYVLGNPRGNENAFLLSFGVVLFRWHNAVASYLHKTRPSWSGERIFQEARKWVIATHQSLVVYKWLPEWLGEDLPRYTEYDPSVDPQIEQFFQTAAMRFGHTLVTPGAYMRDYACGNCKPIPFYGIKQNNKPVKTASEGAVRTCNIFWRPQEPLNMTYKSSPNCDDIESKIADIDRILMGMASQRAEREDNAIVEDLRGNVFGPLEFSRRDLMAVNIQRGRDHGTPDYNVAREALGLKPIRSVDDYLRETKTHTDPEIIAKMERIHNVSGIDGWANIDVWTGGILETTYRAGQLFRAVIRDQFIRIRNADRFWFENRNWKTQRFSKDQIERIRNFEMFDLIVSVTQMKAEDIQQNPFRLPNEDFRKNSNDCFDQNDAWERGTCGDYKNDDMTPSTTHDCYQFPQLHSENHPVEKCTAWKTYDYFDGSDISFMMTFSGIGLIILGIASLVPLTASNRQRKKQMALVKLEARINTSFKQAGIQTSPTLAREWIGFKVPRRSVALVWNKEKIGLDLRRHDGTLLRTIDFSRRSNVDVILVGDGNHLIIKCPNEFDCVLEFGSNFLRTSFYSSLMQSLQTARINVNELSGGLRQCLSHVVTKEKRIARLETFFKVAFAHAFAIEQPKGKDKALDADVIKLVFNTELTQTEFGEALGMQPSSTFVERMFDLIDRDNNGYISFREFLDMLVIFSKGSADDKMKLMFDMYDISRSGYLSASEFQAMIRSLVEASNYDANNEEIDKVVMLLFEQRGLNENSKVTLEHFQEMLSHPDNKAALGYAKLNFTGIHLPEETQRRGSRKSYIDTARRTIYSIYGEDIEPHKETQAQGSELMLQDVTFTTQPKKQSAFSRWVELYRLQVFWVVLYTLVLVCIFMERAYSYSFEREGSGLRHIAGYGVSITRGAASAMMFTYSTLLLTMCRNSITYLRETVLHRIIPFDSFLTMHKYIALLGFFSALMHIIGHSINFYHISTQTAADLSCIFRDYFRPTHVLPKFHYWAFQTLTGITGILLVIHGAFIYTFSTKYARANSFRIFWISHATYPLFYILMLLHGSGRLVQEPLFGLFLVGPLVIFILDRVVTVSRKKVEIPVTDAKLLPSNVTKLVFARPVGFEYKSGQWVKIACLDLNPNEFHPFTLSSAPHEPQLSVHIRAVGPFTANIRQIYDRTQRPLPKLFLDGPYGEGHQDWWRYEVSVLVGGGIGVTPFASILKDVAANPNPRNCKKIYFFWVTRTQKQFEWLVDIIRETEKCKFISVHLFITQAYEQFDMRTVLLYMCERHFQRVSNRSLFTGLTSKTHFGRPNFVSILKCLTKIHSNVKKFGVFSCGPFSMTKSVDEACSIVSSLEDTNSCVFQHHFENF